MSRFSVTVQLFELNKKLYLHIQYNFKTTNHIRSGKAIRKWSITLSITKEETETHKVSHVSTGTHN